MIADDPPLARTHDVFNQPPPLQNYNLFGSDRALVAAASHFVAVNDMEGLERLGALAGSPEAIAWGFAANENVPVLRTHDRFGHRIDEVEFHPAYHQLMTQAMLHGLHSSSWTSKKPAAHVLRSIGFYLWSQVESGHGCPISMTHAAVPALRQQPDLARQWEPAIFATSYDPVLRPLAEKSGVLLGMAMTEKQGGSDVRANTTRATPVGGGGLGTEYRVVGHKWFCSAPMSDAFVILAQASKGLSCFLLPRILPDGTRNNFAIQRLKAKLGNRSNASSEVEWDGAAAWLIGEEGRGVPTIAEMINFTRLDCIIGSAAGMRAALVQAIHHMTHRRAFGKALIEQPLARNVLADLALESAAAMFTFMRIAGACGASASDAHEAGIKRVGTAIGKYWVCKRAPAFTGEALEALGGNGYIEESIMPRLFRESPLNGIWEGSGSVNALDVLRIFAKEPAAIEAFLAELATARGANTRYDAAVALIHAGLADRADLEWRARSIVERMALTFQASLLLRFGDAAVADLFCATRLGGDWGYTFGTLPRGVDAARIIDLAFPIE